MMSELDANSISCISDEGTNFDKGVLQMNEWDNNEERISFGRNLDSLISTSVLDNENFVVTQQPTQDFTPRRPLPVYTLHWNSITQPQFLPGSGLDFLDGVTALILQRITENLYASENSPRRYVVKVPNGETLYMASENSTQLQRLLFGSQRNFTMGLLDATRQEAVILVRRGNSLNCFAEQAIELYRPENNFLIGKVLKDQHSALTSFSILDEPNNIILKIVDTQDPSNSNQESKFMITNSNEVTLGSITRKWDIDVKDTVTEISFPDIPKEHKVLILGASLLIEYMFFTKQRCLIIGCC